MTRVTLISILLYMKSFIISLAICLFFNVLCNESLIGHFSLFYIQVMILFVIEEVRLRIDERLNCRQDSLEDVEHDRLCQAIIHHSQLNSDITELGFILVPEDLFTERAQYLQQHYPHVIQGNLRMFNNLLNNNKHEDIGISWLVARGYTADKLDELKEDMPRILAYLRNVQTAKAIDAL